MAYTIPTIEPLQPRAGDTWMWTLALADFPATSWELTYILVSATAKITITASADGENHAVDVAAATTAAYAAGRYDWTSYVSDGTDRHSVGAGSMEVLPDLAVASAYDGRSHARKMLEAIEAILEGRATNENIDLVSTSIQDQTVTRNPEELHRLRAYYAAIVAGEDAENSTGSAGNSRRGFVQGRF